MKSTTRGLHQLVAAVVLGVQTSCPFALCHKLAALVVASTSDHVMALLAFAFCGAEQVMMTT